MERRDAIQSCDKRTSMFLLPLPLLYPPRLQRLLIDVRLDPSHPSPSTLELSHHHVQAMSLPLGHEASPRLHHRSCLQTAENRFIPVVIRSNLRNAPRMLPSSCVIMSLLRSESREERLLHSTPYATTSGPSDAMSFCTEPVSSSVNQRRERHEATVRDPLEPLTVGHGATGCV